MFFLRRRRVFIGECDGQAVYYDRKTGEALAAPKSRLLNTEKALVSSILYLEVL